MPVDKMSCVVWIDMRPSALWLWSKLKLLIPCIASLAGSHGSLLNNSPVQVPAKPVCLHVTHLASSLSLCYSSIS